MIGGLETSFFFLSPMCIEAEIEGDGGKRKKEKSPVLLLWCLADRISFLPLPPPSPFGRNALVHDDAACVGGDSLPRRLNVNNAPTLCKFQMLVAAARCSAELAAA